MNRLNFKAIAFLSLLLLILQSCGKKSSYETMDGLIWNTTYHIVWNGDRSLNDSILHSLAEVGRVLSVFDEDSMVSQVNRDSCTKVNPMFIEVYTAAKRINVESGGKFDPTLAPLIQAWGFGKGHECSADTADIQKLLQLVGIQKTRLVGDTLVKDNKAISFNFSAIAKGYGCDAVAMMFERNGVSDYLIEIGGEIRVNGSSPSNQKWRVSIDKPTIQPGAPDHQSQQVIEVTDCGIATSGNYRNFHGVGDNRFGHTLDPVSGRPTETDVLSATVIAPTAMEADAYATSCMVLGSKGSSELARAQNLAIMLVLSDSTVYESEAFKLLSK